MSTFHVGKNGVARCHAKTLYGCPYGGESHSETKEGAQEEYERRERFFSQDMPDYIRKRLENPETKDREERCYAMDVLADNRVKPYDLKAADVFIDNGFIRPSERESFRVSLSVERDPILAFESVKMKREYEGLSLIDRELRKKFSRDLENLDDEVERFDSEMSVVVTDYRGNKTEIPSREVRSVSSDDFEKILKDFRLTGFIEQRKVSQDGGGFVVEIKPIGETVAGVVARIKRTPEGNKQAIDETLKTMTGDWERQKVVSDGDGFIVTSVDHRGKTSDTHFSQKELSSYSYEDIEGKIKDRIHSVHENGYIVDPALNDRSL